LIEQNGDFPDLSVVLRKEPPLQIRLGSHDSPPLASCKSQVQALAKRLLQNRPRWIRQLARQPDSWRDLEREIDQEVRQHTGHFLAALLQEASQESAFLEASEQVRQQAVVPIKPPQTRRSQIRLLCGLVLYVTTFYCPPRPVPRKTAAKDLQEQHAGLFPELAALGIALGCTPALMETVARTVVMSPSLALAQRELAQQGLRLDKKAVRRIAVQCGEQLLALRRRELLKWREGDLPAGDELAGQWVAVQIDGGRLRTRKTKASPKKRTKAKRTKAKRQKFDTPWREPKLLVIYTFNRQGKMISKQRQPLIEGTLLGPDHLAELVAFHLHRLGAARAQQVVFVSDGAPWIWDRIDWIVQCAKIKTHRVTQVLDFCHAAHHISLGLEALGYTGSERQQLYHQLRQQLKAGQWDSVWAQLLALAGNASDDSAVWTEMDYLLKHGEAGRLDYRRFRRRGIPCGSGAIESTIRRVINLRFKSNGMFWREENAEALFAVRGLWLSGRWDETLKRMRSRLATDRRRLWKWQAPDIPSELNTAAQAKNVSEQPQQNQPLATTTA
jgi:hypothetical protein